MFISRNIRKQQSDDDLINDYIAHEDVESLEEIFIRYSHLIFLSCLKYLKNEEDSKDAVLEIFEKLTIDLKNHDISNLQNWLRSVARNYCLMKIRKSNRHRSIILDTEALSQLLIEVGTPNDEKEIQFQELHQAIDELKESQRICIQMFYLDNKTYKEIIDLTGLNFRQVKTNIQNGRRNLKKKFDQAASQRDE